MKKVWKIFLIIYNFEERKRNRSDYDLWMCVFLFLSWSILKWEQIDVESIARRTEKQNAWEIAENRSRGDSLSSGAMSDVVRCRPWFSSFLRRKLWVIFHVNDCQTNRTDDITFSAAFKWNTYFSRRYFPRNCRAARLGSTWLHVARATVYVAFFLFYPGKRWNNLEFGAVFVKQSTNEAFN